MRFSILIPLALSAQLSIVPLYAAMTDDVEMTSSSSASCSSSSQSDEDSPRQVQAGYPFKRLTKLLQNEEKSSDIYDFAQKSLPKGQIQGERQKAFLDSLQQALDENEKTPQPFLTIISELKFLGVAQKITDQIRFSLSRYIGWREYIRITAGADEKFDGYSNKRLLTRHQMLAESLFQAAILELKECYLWSYTVNESGKNVRYLEKFIRQIPLLEDVE